MTAMQEASAAARKQLQALAGGSNGHANGGSVHVVHDWGPPATLTRLNTVLDGVHMCDVV